jgi:hypothetical protein
VDWITSREAAAILGVSRVRVSQLAHRDMLPYVTLDGRLYPRRPQIEVVAHAPDTRPYSGSIMLARRSASSRLLAEALSRWPCACTADRAPG